LTYSYSRQIPPGGTGEVTLKINTDGEAGHKVVKKAVVYTNDPENAIIDLILTGNVISPVDIEPKAARLIGIAGEKIQIDIKIMPPANNQFDITSFKAEDGQNIKVQLENIKAQGNPVFILRISNVNPNPGRYSDKIFLTTTSTLNPEITVRVFGIIREK